MDNQTQNLQHALLPIYTVKKSADGNVIGRRKIHFQINAGNTYKISYKFFMPQGFHLDPNVTSEVDCQLVNGKLSVPEVTFVYIKDAAASHPQNSAVTVKFLDANTGHQISQENVFGSPGHHLNVLQQSSVPSGYHLLGNQKTDLMVQNHSQSLNLLVRQGQSAPKMAKVQTTSLNSGSHNQQGAVSDQIVRHSFQVYNQRLSQTLLSLILHHNLKLLKRIVVALSHNAGYQDTGALKVDAKHHKVIGLADNGSGTHNGIYFRARRYQQSHPVSVSEIRDFVTCVMDSHANKGWFITTSAFSSAAQHEAHRHHIKMINGQQLTRLMVKKRIGTQTRSVYKVAGLNPGFFK